jgi:hypothetical protein
MVGMELDLALIVRQLPVESAYGLHALQPVLRQGFGSRGEGVANNPLVQFTPVLNIKIKNNVNARFCKKNRNFSCKNPAKNK